MLLFQDSIVYKTKNVSVSGYNKPPRSRVWNEKYPQENGKVVVNADTNVINDDCVFL